jgi:hypothetical protein
MAIKENIQAVINVIQNERHNDPEGDSPTADRLQQRAQAAIIAGQGQPAAGQPSPQWVTYMGEFVVPPNNPEQLGRLTATDGTHADPDRQKERAYLVSNGMCGAGTTDDLLNGDVTLFLDRP